MVDEICLITIILSKIFFFWVVKAITLIYTLQDLWFVKSHLTHTSRQNQIIDTGALGRAWVLERMPSRWMFCPLVYAVTVSVAKLHCVTFKRSKHDINLKTERYETKNTVLSIVTGTRVHEHLLVSTPVSFWLAASKQHRVTGACHTSADKRPSWEMSIRHAWGSDVTNRSCWSYKDAMYRVMDKPSKRYTHKHAWEAE